MTTPVAITLTSLGAQSDSPTATTPAVDGSPFADILALLSQPGNKQALLQNLQASLDGDAKGPQSALLGRLSQLDAQQRQTLLEQLRTPTPDGVTPCPMPPGPAADVTHGDGHPSLSRRGPGRCTASHRRLAGHAAGAR
ncbi:hypothetical protein NHU85_06180 [Edwardsiella tarda]|uniref:hypothetical protein n=1 Tax=Edwardsiella tarda TaxID=636 RepID=UPI0026709C75|nr:hypothetical protein [Edwardsiella tarda]WKS82357.1 hypothetical protein NHU85_06180 [Edwardsiella tarda]